MSATQAAKPPPSNGQAPKQEASTPVSIAQAFLGKRVTHIEEVLPEGMKGQGERLIKRALLTMSKNQNLMGCTIESFYHCVLAGAELGLAIDGKLAHAVPYGKVAQFQIDYKGMVAVARRTKAIKNTYARLVYDDDQFKQRTIDGVDHFEHTPGPRKAAVAGAYAVVIFPDNSIQMEWMAVHELDAIQGRSKAGSGPWKTDPGEMRKKTVLKRLLKMFMDADSYLVSAYIAEEEDDVIDGTATPHVEEPPQGRVSHKNRLTGEMPMGANFNGHQNEREAEPVHQQNAQAAHAHQHQQAPVYDESKEIERQELIASLNEQLSNELGPKQLHDFYILLTRNEALLGPDVFGDMMKRYVAKTHPKVAEPAKKDRNF